MRFSSLVVPDLPVRAARLVDASLARREIVVHAGGRVVALSEEARQQGIEVGWSLERARCTAPAAVAMALQEAEVRRVRESLLLELNRATPWIEVLESRGGHDACLVLRAVAVLPEGAGAMVRAWGPAGFEDAGSPSRPAALAGAPQCPPDRHPSVVAALAGRLQSRVGVACDRSTSLLAALATAVGQVEAIAEGGEKAFRDRLPLAVLREAGVCEETLERLHWLGFESVGRLARLSERQVRAQFADGPLLCWLLGTADRRPVPLFQPPPAVSASHEMADPVTEPGEYEPVLWHLVHTAVGGLDGREAGMVTVTLGLLRGDVLRPASASRFPHAPTADPAEIRTLARLALEEARGGWRGAGRAVALEPAHRLAPEEARGGWRGAGRAVALEPAHRLALEEARGGERDAIVSMTLALGALVRPRPEEVGLWHERTRELRRVLERLEMQMPNAILRFVPREAASALPEEAYRLVSAVPPSGGPTASPGPRGRRASRRSTGGPGMRHDGSTATGWEDFNEALSGTD